MTEWILYRAILRLSVSAIPLQRVLPLRSESIRFISVQFNFHFCSVVIRIDHVGILWQMCVFHFREPSVSWYSQTASDWLAAVWGPDGTGGTVSVLSVCMCKACIIHMHTYIYMYICRNERMSMCAVHVQPYFCVTGFRFTVSWMCACIYCLLWACGL